MGSKGKKLLLFLFLKQSKAATYKRRKNHTTLLFKSFMSIGILIFKLTPAHTRSRRYIINIEIRRVVYEISFIINFYIINYFSFITKW